VVPLAPRYDDRIQQAIRALDDTAHPIAETCREVGVVAATFGLPKPSYVDVRRLVLAERERVVTDRMRREAMRALLEDVATKALLGRSVNAYEVAERAAKIRERYG
jgi:hypothetical protein